MAPRNMVKALVFACIGSYGLVNGLQRCSSATDHAEPQLTEDACMNIMQSPSCEVQRKSNYLEQLTETCSEDGGFIAGCSMKKKRGAAGAVLGHHVEFNVATNEIEAHWELNKYVVDVNNQVEVAFRYFAQEAVTLILYTSDTEDTPLQFEINGNASVETDWCTSASISLFPVEEQSNGKFYVKLKVPAAGPESIVIDALFIKFESLVSDDSSGNALTNGNCHDRPIDECDPEVDKQCACLAHHSSMVEHVPHHLRFLILPVTILILLLPLLGLCVIRCWAKRVWKQEEGLEASKKKETGRRKLSEISHKELSRPESKKEESRPNPAESLASAKDNDLNELDQVLSSPASRKEFSSFLQSNFGCESFIFFESIEMYEAITDRSCRETEAKEMLDRFVAPGAPYAVPLSSKVQRKLLTARSFSRNLFTDAKLEVRTLMQERFLPSFIVQRGSTALELA